MVGLRHKLAEVKDLEVRKKVETVNIHKWGFRAEVRMDK